MAETDARSAPPADQHGVVDYELTVDGKNVARDFQVISMATAAEVNAVPSARIVLRDGGSAAESFKVSEKDVFVPGKKVVVKLGGTQEKKTVFQGIIVKQAIRARGETGATLTVECRHAAMKATLGRKDKYFIDKKDSEIIEDILGPLGLKGSIEATEVTHKEVVQFRTTDWDFVNLRAEANGKLVIAEGERINLKKPDTSAAPVKTLLYGENIMEFEAELDARTQWKSVKSTSWDYAGQALAEEEAGSAPVEEAGNLPGSKLSEVGGLANFEMRHSGQVLPQELKAWAGAAMLKSRLSKVRGRARIKGDGDIKPGSVVKLGGCGARFNGKVLVTGVRHEVVSGSWFTQVQFGLSPDWFFQKTDLAQPPAAGLTTPIGGLQIGVAVQLEGDPDGEDRILVRLPTLDAKAKGIWSRVSTLDAGKERGTFFRPEIGDELVVGFLNDDPREAVVLGMLNSSAKPAPLQAKDDNHIKGLQTRSKMKLMFDDEKKKVTLETPAGNSFTIDEDQKSITLKDQHGNKIVMDKDGIAIHSIKDLKVTADKDISQKATGNMALEATQNLDAKASMSLSAKGSASAEFSASGSTTLKGATVMIN